MKYLLFVLCFVFVSVVNAQFYPTQHYTTEQGLLQNQLVNLVNMPNGMLWIASTSGITAFDGEVFSPIYFKDVSETQNIRNMNADSKGNIWIFLSTGFVKVLPDSLIAYPHNLEITISEYLGMSKHNTQYMMRYTLEGRVVYAFNGEQYNRVALMADKEFFNHQDSTVYYYQKLNKESILFGKKEGTADTLKMSTITSFDPIDAHSVLISDSSYFYIYNANKPLRRLCERNIYALNIRDGLLLVGSSIKNAYTLFYLKSNKQKTMYLNNLHGTNIRDLIYTYDSVLFVATENGLVNVKSDAVRYFYAVQLGIEGGLSSMLQIPKDSSWYIATHTAGGLYNWNEKTNKLIQLVSEYKIPDFTFGAEFDFNQNPVWTQGNLLVRKKGNKFVSQNINNKRLIAIKKDHRTKQLAYIGREGLITEDPEGRIIRYNLGWGFFGGTDLEPDKENGWFITANMGFCHFKDGEYKWLTRTNDGYYAIETDSSGTIWVGGDKGLFYLENEKLIHVPQMNDLVTDIYILNNEQLVIGTINSVILFDLKAFYENKNVMFRKFNHEDGFIDQEVIQHGIRKGLNGNIYILYKELFLEVEPQMLKYSKPGSAYITHVEEYSDSMQWRPIQKTGEKHVVSSNGLKISFSSISFTDQHNMEYEYMLEGYDTAWRSAGNRRFAVYKHLENKNYTFKLRTRFHGQNHLVSEIEMPLMVDIPGNYGWWKYVAIFSFIIVIAAALLFYYSKKKWKNESAQIVKNWKKKTLLLKTINKQADLHYLFNSLSNIRSAIALDMEERAVEFTEALSNVYRYFYDKPDTDVGASIHAELEMIRNYIYVKQMRRGVEFVEFKIDNQLSENEIYYIPRFSIYTHIENIFHHAFPDNAKIAMIKIHIRKNEDSILVCISDNGIGREKASISRVSMMRKKESIKGQILLYEMLKQINNQSNNHIELSFTDLQVPSGLQVDLKIPKHYTYKIPEKHFIFT